MEVPPGTRLTGTTSSARGRGLIATRDFQPGDLIGTFSNPILALPDGPSMRTTCNYCLSPSLGRSLPACSRCKATVYCNHECQRAHWKIVHKAECKMFTKVRESVGKNWLPTPTRAAAQILLLLKAGYPPVVAAFGDNGTLEGNVDAFKRHPEVWADYELQSMAAVVYSDLVESEEMLERAKIILCKVGRSRPI